jgi:glycosyltransferase involved in cell wall biosynthesis
MKYKVHVLYEYGIDLQPHGSAHIRLLRPLQHPALRRFLDVSYGREYEGQAVDAVILDRLWRPDVSLALVENLVEKIRKNGSKLIYTLDDNFLDLPAEREDWPTEAHLQVVRFLLREADSVWVTTEPLRDRYADFNQNIIVIPNALDERLIRLTGLGKVKKRLSRVRSRFSRVLPPNSHKLIVGYMGTLTHDKDLMLILPALRQVYQHYPDNFEFQILGVVGDSETIELLGGLPVRILPLEPRKVRYPTFIKWFAHHFDWDIALAPLRNTLFTRCKSDIKFLDYSAIGAAGIYSRVPAYMSSVRHLETGWLVDNTTEAWGKAIEQLIHRRELRKQIGQNAYQYLFSERVLCRCVQAWLDALAYTLRDDVH